jgi:prevent-host-death family protein
MRTVGVSQARADLPALVDRAHHHDLPAMLTKHGRPLAVLVSWSWYETHRGDDDPSWYEARKGDEDADVNQSGSLSPIAGHE